MRPYWYIPIIFCCVLGIPATLEISPSTKPTTNVKEMRNIIMDIVNSISKQTLPLVHRMATEANVSTRCILSGLKFFKDLSRLKKWALEMFDASAKPPSGILEGTIMWFGEYEECLDIEVSNVRRKSLFVGEYCLVELMNRNLNVSEFIKLRKTKLVSDLSFHFGLCVPSTCSSQDVQNLASIATRPLGISTKVTCQTKRKKEIPNVEQIVFLGVFAALGLMVILGTSLDLLNQRFTIGNKTGELNKFLQAFSVYSNTIRLFDTAQREKELSAVRGIRVLTAFWIIIAHTYFTPTKLTFTKYKRMVGYEEFLEQFMFDAIIGASLGLDTFFMLSAMVFVYTTWRKLESSKGWINPFTYFPPRMARLVFIQMFIIALTMVFPLFGNGPIWNEIWKEQTEVCRNNWWRNVLFIQNLWPGETICIVQTWFIGCLFQLFILFFCVIMVLYRWPKIGISIYVTFIVGGCIVTGAVISSYNTLPLLHFTEDLATARKYYFIVFTRPYTYFPSYCMGVLLGYAIVTKRQPKIKPVVQMLAWFLATCGAVVAVFGIHLFNLDIDGVDTIVYASLQRVIWSCSVSWIFYACVTGYGGPIERLLSWKAMVPLDRLTLLIYLLHLLVIYYRVGMTRTVTYLSHLEQVYSFLGTTVITVIFAYILNVTFEQPMRNLETYIVRKLSKKPLPKIVPPHPNTPTHLQNICILSADPILEEKNSTKL